MSNSRWIPFRTKWLWVRLQSLSLNVQILRVMYSSKMPILTRAKAQTAATCPCGFSRGEFQQPRRDHMILFFRRKVKKDFSQKKKIHGNMIFSSNVRKRWPFQKNCAGAWFFLYYLEKWQNGIFSTPKTWYLFLWTDNERWSCSRDTWKYDTLSIYV